MRIAFFGGTFDPPHKGHLGLARAARQALDLDTVLFAPVGRQPLKPSGSSASFEDRVAMTHLAIAGQPGFELSLIDSPTPSGAVPNYTAETLASLRQSLPGGAELYLLIGADSLRALPQWHRADEIPFLANLIVAARPGEDLSNLEACFPAGITLQLTQPNHYRLANHQGQQSQLILLLDTHYEISATQLRDSIRSSSPSTQPALIPKPVLEYIHQHHLYE